MQIIVSGKNVAVGQALTSHAEVRLEDGINKYLDRVTSVNVVVSKQGHEFRVDITGNTGTNSGLTVRSHASDADVYSAFDLAADKIEKQLRRYKRRIKNHHKTRESHAEREAQMLTAKKFVITDFDDESAKDDSDTSPTIIAEKVTDIENMSVSHAVMKMDLADLPTILFINSSTGNLNIVYRRKDGNISWVDPSEAIESLASKKVA